MDSENSEYLEWEYERPAAVKGIITDSLDINEFTHSTIIDSKFKIYHVLSGLKECHVSCSSPYNTVV